MMIELHHKEQVINNNYSIEMIFACMSYIGEHRNQPENNWLPLGVEEIIKYDY